MTPTVPDPGREEPRRRTPPVSVRLDAQLHAWYERRAAERGTSPHALMVAALRRFRDEGDAA